MTQDSENSLLFLPLASKTIDPTQHKQATACYRAVLYTVSMPVTVQTTPGW